MGPSHFHLFGPLQKYVFGKQFTKDATMKVAVTSWLQILDTDFFYARIQTLVPMWEKYFNVNGDYMEV
jgi:hypothetical protein